jgi:hypothetical protein
VFFTSFTTANSSILKLQMSRPPRRLFLHLSALSDEEYNAYISALRDVIDDEHEIACASEQELENRVLGVREVRAWMKGRYRDVHDIDKVRCIECYLCATIKLNYCRFCVCSLQIYCRRIPYLEDSFLQHSD